MEASRVMVRQATVPLQAAGHYAKIAGETIFSIRRVCYFLFMIQNALQNPQAQLGDSLLSHTVKITTYSYGMDLLNQKSCMFAGFRANDFAIPSMKTC